MVPEELLVSRVGNVGRIQLNRPKALNSLTLEMVRGFTAALEAFGSSRDIVAVLLTGEGERGLCAGGDIRALYDLRHGDREPYRVFWREEYRLNAMIAAFRKPFVALMDGLVMGGGVGVSAHGGIRIVTERTRLAMPEATIGFIPDVGGTWLLSRGGGAGVYMALSGATVNAADAIHVGLADVAVSSSDLEEPVGRLCRIKRGEEIHDILSSLAYKPAPGELERHKEMLDHAMQGHDVAEILRRLRSSSEAFATEAATRIAANSPTSLVVTHRLLAMAAKARRLEDCLTNEFRAACCLLESNDLYEGIRAAIIDKDKAPRWHPETLDEVSDAIVAAIIAGDGGDDPAFAT